MKFSTREDIDLPITDVFAQVSDIAQFERAALRRGVKVRRVDDLAQTGVGNAWDIAFELRGKQRNLQAQLVSYDPPNGLAFDGVSGGLEQYLLVDLTALSQKRTRLRIELELTPKTLSARLMVQSFKLAKTTLTKRFKKRVAEFARDVEKKPSRAS